MTALATLAPTPSYLDALNPQQREAVEALHGPVLILAGAGTGKTRVLTARLVHILASGLAYPSQILSVTFTNKAAAEMKHRVADLLQRPTEGLWMGTFHSLAVRMLRHHGERIGINSAFTILDTDDQQRLIKQILVAENIDDKKNSPRMVAAVISRWKDQGLTPEKAPTSDRLLGHVYKLYQERLQVLNAVDFGDLLLQCLTLFNTCPDVLESYQKQFHYILVDEYQDTNVVQYLWLRLLAQGNRNICCVGDDDQSIYGWRGAEVGNILRFERDFPGAKVIRLEQNYRSTPHILGAASCLIACNTGRLGKTLWTEVDAGEKVVVSGAWDSTEEARNVGDMIERLQRQGHGLSSMAILVRAGFQTREFEERFLQLGIAYKVIGGLRFYERQEIRDALAYFRLVSQPNDSLAFERIINVPKRGVGGAALQTIHVHARTHGLSLASAARELIEEGKFSGKAKASLAEFFRNLDRWRDHLDDLNHVELAQMILEESGYTAMWKQDKSPDAPGRLENLKELIQAMKSFETLPSFLEHISLVMDTTQDNQEQMVAIMTLHAAKGLEFDTVFLCGWEENLFPHPRALEENGAEGLEEERRLAYVGLTRGRQRAIITFALRRRSYQGWQDCLPSRFIRELPDEHVELKPMNGGNRSFSVPSYGRVIDVDFD